MEDPRIGLVLGDRYRIQERLAAGGTGVVYRGVQIGLARTVAVKFLHQSSAGSMIGRGRFRREAEAMSRLTHPNLAAIIDFGAYKDTLYLVMELYEGMSLRQVLEAGPLELARAVNITRQILAGLASAHDAGVVHRDLKPGNVLLAVSLGDDHVKILDFGVAKLVGGPASTEGLSIVGGKPIGTPQYMSPEQARGELADPRTDLYATGILLYEMCTGKRPFDGSGVGFAILRQQVEDDPTPPRELRPEISAELEAAILKAMSKARDDRFESAADMAAALALVPELEPPRSERAVARARRFRVVTAMLLVLLTLTGTGAWLAAARGWVDVPSWSPWQPGDEALAAVEPPRLDAGVPIDAPPPPPPWAPPAAEVVLAAAPARGAVTNRRLRGAVDRASFRPTFARLTDAGDRVVLDVSLEPPAGEGDVCVRPLLSGVRLELDRQLLSKEPVNGERAATAVVLGEPERALEVRAQMRVEVADAETGAARGTIRVRGDGLRLAGPFDAIYCPDPRAYPTEPPRVNGVSWDPDRAPAPDELPAASVAGAFGPAEIHPEHVSLVSASDPDRLVLSFFERAPVDPCDELADRRGVAVVFPATALDDTYALSAVLQDTTRSDPLWVGLQPDVSQSPGPAMVEGDIVSLRIDAVSPVDVRGRIYVAAADRRRSLLVGAFRAVDCR